MVEKFPFLDRRMALCVVLPLVIVASTACWRWNGTAQRLHDEARQDLDAKGLVDSLEKLAHRLQQSEDDSKAKQWKTLATSIRHLPGPLQPSLGRVRTFFVPPYGQNWELGTAIRSFVDSHSSIFAELCALNKDPSVLSLVPTEDFLNRWLDSASDNILVSTGLEWVGCVALHDNDEAGVLRAIEDLYECRQTLQGVAPSMGAFVRFDLSQRGLSLLRMALERGLFGRKSLELIQPIVFEHVEVDRGWLAAIEFELAMHLDIMNGGAELNGNHSSAIATKIARYVLPPASLMDRVRFLTLIQNLAEVPTDNLAAFQAAQLQCDVLFAELRSAGTRFDFDSTGFANDHTLADAFIADAMRHRLAATAIALQLHRIENGTYPNQLEELTLDESLQPIGGRPIAYTQVNSSATIWIANESPWTTPTRPTLTPLPTYGFGVQHMDREVVWTLNTPIP